MCNIASFAVQEPLVRLPSQAPPPVLEASVLIRTEDLITLTG